MLKKILDFFKSKKQKGQSLIFFAASIPFLCLFVGASMDFGWMYYNQSRLQNAADAAARVGAKTLVGGNGTGTTEVPLSEYSVSKFVSNDEPGLLLMQQASKISPKAKDQLQNGKPYAGDSMAKLYAESNLKGTKQDPTKAQVRLVTDDNVGIVDGYENVKFESTLWGPNEDDEDALYYTVTLSTKLEHLFGGIMENFGIGQLPSVATATVKISYGEAGDDLYTQMKKKESTETFPNWEEIKVQKGNNATAANNRSVLTGGAYYKSGSSNRVEASLLNGKSFASSKGNPYNTGVDQTAFDDLFIDFQGEENRNLTTNGDHDLDVSKVSGNWDYGDTLTGNAQYNFRIHFPVMIVSKYPIRTGKSAPDSLYAFIEQEPIKQQVTLSDGSKYTRGNMSAVRQIIINNDIANTNSTTDRPIVFFYEGPEIPLQKYRSDLYDSDGDYIGDRPFLPVILNLWQDFRGILFAPNNPVIINGNGHKMEGFVVGREFRRLKKWSDFQNAKYSSGSDKGMPAYIYDPSYKGKEAPVYAEVSNWKVKNSSNTNGYKQAKIKLNGIWYSGWVKSGQWYTRDASPDVNRYVQIDISDNTTKFAEVLDSNYKATGNILLDAKLQAGSESTYDIASSGTEYVAKFEGKFYFPIYQESVTYSGTVDSKKIGTWFLAKDKTISQKVNTMYLSGTKYKYTETYLNTEGKQKTKTTIMSIGDVQYVNVTASDSSLDENGNVTGNYTETPRNHDTFADDDKLRFDYVNVFNLDENSTYNSFRNVVLHNYIYLKKTEKTTLASHDMFFTTVRSKHID